MRVSIRPRRGILSVMLIVLGGCALLASERLDESFGEARPQERIAAFDSAATQLYQNEVRPLLEKRCVVCHGCYDAPCQLKLSSAQGIDRGASKDRVYDGTRLLAASPGRLYVDHDGVASWRDNGFYPVLNEREQTPAANRQAGVLSRLLAQKRRHPLPATAVLPDSFDFSLNRSQECPKLEELDSFERKYPDWGMPFGLPGLNQAEDKTLQEWLEAGAKMAPLPPLSADHIREISLWEAFLNGDSLKQQLVGRYLYEHWFVAHLYFSELPTGVFFRVVRSRTPPGEPVDMIATRRPYDDPGAGRIYYRLWQEQETIVAKTHMPYALNRARMKRLSALFLDKDYVVEQPSSYEPRLASNPFKTFQLIPISSRYKFLLDEARFSIMNFIKGPVCRGQVALDVINDHFWVFFVAPTDQVYEKTYALTAEQQEQLSLPAAAGSNALILSTWLKYSSLQREYMQSKVAYLEKAIPEGKYLTLDGVWDGDGHNDNAALTVFRHFDSATVLKGLVGDPPKTAWIIDYGLLERIHYLLVAGFDVYGNIGHQLNTRLYMDFLRMEGEFNFLALLPVKSRVAEIKRWYQGVEGKQLDHLLAPYDSFSQPTGIKFKTDHPKAELYQMLRRRLGPVLSSEYDLQHRDVPGSHRNLLTRLQLIHGDPAILLPQVTFVSVQGKRGIRQYSLLHNNAHSNITNALYEENSRLPTRDSITVTRGLVGAYPDAFISVSEDQLHDYVTAVLALENETGYRGLMSRFGIRRTDPRFWQHSDLIHANRQNSDPSNAGVFDYNRLENR